MRTWLLLATGSCLAACSGSHEPTQTNTVAPRAQVGPTINVPALLGNSIEGLRSRLGPPRSLPAAYSSLVASFNADSSRQTQDSLVAFRAGGLALIACYNARTRQVRDLLLLGRHEDSLMQRASLRPNASSYLVLPIFRADKPGYFIGLRVIATK